ncbi:MAG: hypothetical protein KKB22_03950 [Candidatus Omnitrophica bacterium]|nr:hypothetical protein [Candidatus Omnitrophota bacterium]
MADVAPKKQHTIEYIAIGALVLVAIIIGIARFKKGDVNDEVFSRKEFTQKWKEVEILEAEVPKNEKTIAFAPDGEMFPFRSPFDDTEETKQTDENVVLPEMQFQGMIWKSARPQAIINNKVYDIKDVINVDTAEEGIKIKDINKDGIHLIYRNKEFIIKPK